MLFSRWGAFVYRFRRLVAVIAVVLAVAVRRRSPRQASGALSVRRLARPDVRIGDRRRPPRRRVRRRPGQRSSPCSAARPAPTPASPAFQEAIADVARAASPRTTGSTASIGYARDRATTGSSATDGTSAYVVVDLDDHRRGSRSTRCPSSAALIDQPARAHAPAHRRRRRSRRTRPTSPRRTSSRPRRSRSRSPR